MYIEYLFLFLGISEGFVSNLNITYQDCGSKGYIVYTMTSTDEGFKSLSFNYAVSGANVDSTTSTLSLYGDDSFTCDTPDLSNVNKVGSFFLLTSTLSATDSGNGFLPLFSVEQFSPHTFYQLVDGRPNSLEITNLQLNYQDDSGTVVQYPTVNYFPLPKYIPTPCDSCENSECIVGIDTGTRTCQVKSQSTCTTCSHINFGTGFTVNPAAPTCEFDGEECTFFGFSCADSNDGTQSTCPLDGTFQMCLEPPSPPTCTTCTHIDFGGGLQTNPLASSCTYEKGTCSFSGFSCGTLAGENIEILSCPSVPIPGECYNSDLDISPPQSPLPVQNSPSPPILPPLSPPKIPPVLPQPLPPPLPSPSPSPLNPSPESPPMYPSPFSPPPLTPPSLPSGAEITVRHYIPDDTQVTFALAVNTTLDLNTVKNQNFSMFDTFAKIGYTENRKVLTRVIYNGNTWEPKENAVLNSDFGYIVKLTNGLDMEINGTVLERQTSNVIPENTQVTFSVKKNTNLNTLNKSFFSLNDTVSSIEIIGYKTRIIKTTLFDEGSWVPEENAYLKIGVGYIGKFENGLNKIL